MPRFMPRFRREPVCSGGDHLFEMPATVQAHELSTASLDPAQPCLCQDMTWGEMNQRLERGDRLESMWRRPARGTTSAQAPSGREIDHGEG
jgi:hypothetical protein